MRKRIAPSVRNFFRAVAWRLMFVTPLPKAAMDGLTQEGVPAEVLEHLNAAEHASAAVDRFDRTVNADKFRRRLRLWEPAQN